MIIHNHTEETSFGKDDFIFLKNFGQKIDYLVSVSPNYIYYAKVEKPIDVAYNPYYQKAMFKALASEELIDLQHVAFEEMAKDGVLKYERVKR